MTQKAGSHPSSYLCWTLGYQPAHQQMLLFDPQTVYDLRFILVTTLVTSLFLISIVACSLLRLISQRQKR